MLDNTADDARYLLISFIENAATWSNFAASLADQLQRKGFLSERQWMAAQAMMDKAERLEAERAKPAERVDMAPIHAMFDKAREAGLRRLAYRAEGLVISPASETGKNPGALYVKTLAGDYQGKLLNGEWRPVGSAEAGTTPALHLIARNPAEVATAYGRRTGTCSCCGRELTNAESIARAIGPICAEKWGL